MDLCNNQMRIGIIGAGFSGLCAAIQLKQQLNLENVTVFEENHDVGGTWLVNTYPDCACDVASYLYSFSFEPNPNWSKVYSSQQEILEYLRNVAKKHDLYEKIKFNHKVTQAEYKEEIAKWHISTLDIKHNLEKNYEFDIMISGVGGLRNPNIPSQFDAFEGKKMHSAQWDSSAELKDKVVAVVGSGSSGVQIIPAIVDKVKRLLVYQRNPAWVVPKNQATIPDFMKWAFANIPGLQWSVRSMIYLANEMGYAGYVINTIGSKLAPAWSRWYLASKIKDPQLREKLTPKYAFGCKRVTISSDYYPALTKPNVSVITSKIKDVTSDTIINEDGTREKPDVIILATGFKVTDMFAPMKVVAKGGIDLLQKWKAQRSMAYFGTASSDLPNGFILLGPNTALGHNTVVFMIECQVNWMIQILREKVKRNARTVIVKKAAVDEYVDYLDKQMKSMVWGANDCGSWYADEHGKIIALWPNSSTSFYNYTKTVDFSKFDFD